MESLLLQEITNEDLSALGLTPHDVAIATDTILTKGFIRRLLGSCISPVVTPDFLDLSDYPSMGRYRTPTHKCELVLRASDSERALALVPRAELNEEECYQARARVLDSNGAVYIKAGSQSSGGSGIIRLSSIPDGYRFESDSDEIVRTISEISSCGTLERSDGLEGRPRHVFRVSERDDADKVLHHILLRTKYPVIEEELPLYRPNGTRIEARGYFLGSDWEDELQFLTSLAKISSGAVVGNVNADLPGGYIRSDDAIWKIVSALGEEEFDLPYANELKAALEDNLKMVGNRYSKGIAELIKNVPKDRLFDTLKAYGLDFAVDLAPIWDKQSKTLKWGLIEIQDRPALVPEVKAIMDQDSLYRLESSRSFYNNEGYD